MGSKQRRYPDKVMLEYVGKTKKVISNVTPGGSYRMSLDIISEVWDALREHIDLSERNDAAYTLVNFLIDNNFEIEDIKDASRTKISLKH